MKRFSRIVPVLVGMLLLTAAVLKTENLPLEEKLHDGLLGSRVFLVSVVAGEFLLAAWLLSGWYASRCRQVTMGLFALFALVTLAKGLSGAASCGCFGRYEVNPWWTFLLDLGVLSLLRLTPHTGDVASNPYRATRGPGPCGPRYSACWWPCWRSGGWYPPERRPLKESSLGRVDW